MGSGGQPPLSFPLFLLEIIMTQSLDVIRPKTKLDAVNDILRSRGMKSVSTIEQSGDSRDAAQHLASSLVDVQSDDWNFNTDEERLFSPDPSGHIYIPDDILSFKPVYYSADEKLTLRGGRLYDRGNNTFIFTKGIYLETKTGIAFDDLPQPFRIYITVHAALSFANANTPGSPSIRGIEQALARALSIASTFDEKLGGVSNSYPQAAGWRRGR
jgi:hypothetical protein